MRHMRYIEYIMDALEDHLISFYKQLFKNIAHDVCLTLRIMPYLCICVFVYLYLCIQHLKISHLIP